MSTCSVGSTRSTVFRPSEAKLRHAVQATVALLCSVWTMIICKAIIGCASAFDTYLTIKYAESLNVYEQNPLGRWLMGLDNGPVAATQQIAAFITAKFLGTICVLVALQGLAFWRIRLAAIIAIPVAAFQASLVAHLLFASG